MKFPDFEIREDLDPYTAPTAINPGWCAHLETACEAESAIAKLVTAARTGDGKALWRFAKLVCVVGETLSQITRTNPKAMTPLARKMPRWPMMRSKHPLLCDPAEWLKEIELGKDVPLEVWSGAKWKPDHAADVAIQLLNYLQELRRSNVVFVFKNKKIRAKDHLPEFNRETAPKWWLLAKHCLTESYPNAKHWKLRGTRFSRMGTVSRLASAEHRKVTSHETNS